MTNATLQMDTLTCPMCARKIEAALRRTPGVAACEVLFNTSRAKITYDEARVTPDGLRAVVATLGYQVLSVK